MEFDEFCELSEKMFGQTRALLAELHIEMIKIGQSSLHLDTE